MKYAYDTTKMRLKSFAQSTLIQAKLNKIEPPTEVML